MNSRHYKPFAQGRKRLLLPCIPLCCQGITVGIPFYTTSDRHHILGCLCVSIIRPLYRGLCALLRRHTIIELDQVLLVLHYPCTSRDNTSHDDILFESA